MAKKLRKKGKDWCRAELVVVRLCSGNVRVKQIGLLIGRSESAVRTKAREVGINLRLRGRFHQSVKYSDADVELARELHSAGVKLREIAEKLELPRGMVDQYVYLERRASV
ncbi:DNA-binding protein [Kluyvera intermedia]|uniref:DNA-binding protein n=1 Tax=Kluyvera intermedia TaxID=61648 RepID=UPI0034A1B6DC